MGSLTEYPPDQYGRWGFRLRVYVGTYPGTGKPKQDTKVWRAPIGVSKREAKRLAEREMARMEDEATGHRGTVGELLDEWLEFCRNRRLERQTIRGYESKVKSIKAALGGIPLAVLTTKDVDKFYGSIKGKVAPYHRVLRAALGQAVKWKMVRENVAEHATLPRSPRRQSTVPVPDEVRLLIKEAAAQHEQLPSIITLAALTGCRQGEMAALRFSDVTGDVLTIARSIWQTKGDWGTKTPKNGTGRQAILHPLALALIEQRRAAGVEAARQAGVAWSPDAYIYSPDPLGVIPWMPDRLSKMFGKVKSTLGLSCRFHDLRHFAGAEMAAAGVNPRTIADRLGHAQVSFTLQTYTVGRLEQDRQAANALGAALGTDLHNSPST